MIDVLKPLIKQFLPFAQEKMGFERPPRLFLKQDAENAANPLGKTGFYDPQAESITLFITGRHPKDVMRSLSHELMHHTQKCNGEFENVENMGEQGYAQNNPHMRTMEIHAYQASIVFRDWEDSIKGTIYNESLQKGANENMSTKNWKDRELNTLLMEKWGFKFDPDGLTEDQGFGEGEPADDEWSKKQEIEEYGWPSSSGDPARKEPCEDEPVKTQWNGKECVDPTEEATEELEEGFEHPKSATGAGPTNKAGKTDRGDVANKDTSKFGQGGSKGGGKTSASGANTPSKAGKMDRSDVANKATGRWLKEEEELEEMCPPESHVEPEEEEEDLEERRGRGRADPRNQRGPADPRQRPMEEVRLREVLKGRKISEEQMRQIIRKTLELRQERKVNKG